MRADVNVHGSDELEAWALGSTRRFTVGDLSVAFAPPEYVILRKLEYYRDSGSGRHLRDVAMMLRISEPSIDFGLIEGWAERRGTTEAWVPALAFEP